MNKDWVQHNSDHGDKWPLVEMADHTFSWCVYDGNGQQYRLPKSVYQLCSPSERWVDISLHCHMKRNGNGLIHSEHNEVSLVGTIYSGFRLQKLELQYPGPESLRDTQWAFIVEKKVPE